MPSTSFPVPSKFPLGPPAAVCGSGETLRPAPPAGGTMKAAEEEHYSYASQSIASTLPLPTAHTSLSAPCHDLQTSTPGISAVPSANHPSSYGGAVDGGPSGYFLSSGNTRPNGAPTLESPRIEITSYLGLHHGGSQFFHDVEVEDVLPSCKRSPSTATLHLPSLEAYRDPSCLSPASSLSSRSCNSEASSYESNYSYPYASPQTSPWQSPCVSPKTTDPEEGFPRGLGACHLLGSPRHSPSNSPRASVTEESWLGARGSRPTSPCNKRKYSLNGRQPSCSPHHSPTPSPHGSPRVSVTEDTWLGNTTQYTSSAIVAAINALTTDSTLDLGEGVPIKSRKTTLEHAPSVALKVEPAGEDLGTTPPASDFPPEEFAFQHLRKGAFGEQYLSVPQAPYQWAKPKSLSPTSYMSIDCAGILKLRNSDIELRKGETDIGRKNTRVRLVFRVHIPQPNGRMLSLQVASNPIECSQRSAQELPLVEKQSTDSYPVTGGKKMVLSGHNFLQDSKVVFVEKAPDGHHVWEMEAKTDRDLCKPNSLVVEIPPFRNQRITSPVQVSFYVCNGKRKRSQCQHFTYLPANVPIVKTEPTDDFEPALTCGPMSQGLSPLPRPYYSQQLTMPPNPGSCLVAGFAPCSQRSTLMTTPPNASPKLHDLSSTAYTKGLTSPGHSGHLGLQPPASEAPTMQEVPRPMAMQPNSPEQPPPARLQPQVSPHLNSSCSLGCQQVLCPNSPSSPLPSTAHEPTCLQPSALPPDVGHQQQQLQKIQRNESPPALPEVREDSDHNLAPIPVVIKQEPEELDQLYLDDGPRQGLLSSLSLRLRPCSLSATLPHASACEPDGPFVSRGPSRRTFGSG
ncbi:Nfatc1 [Phodopus roborovskii]|uniref:Nfatc1 protein n=1 Tax=Phodopus roborovskii TaxID=109678 RepID=A0AAV0A1C0_PHORO|nr:Nfatc1 [Phodopus roborovskii]